MEGGPVDPGFDLGDIGDPQYGGSSSIRGIVLNTSHRSHYVGSSSIRAIVLNAGDRPQYKPSSSIRAIVLNTGDRSQYKPSSSIRGSSLIRGVVLNTWGGHPKSAAGVGGGE